MMAVADTSVNMAPIRVPASSESHRHAEVAEEQKQERHEEDDQCAAHVWPPGGGAMPSIAATCGGGSGGSSCSKPLRSPLISCSRVNSATRMPQIGIAA